MSSISQKHTVPELVFDKDPKQFKKNVLQTLYQQEKTTSPKNPYDPIYEEKYNRINTLVKELVDHKCFPNKSQKFEVKDEHIKAIIDALQEFIKKNPTRLLTVLHFIPKRFQKIRILNDWKTLAKLWLSSMNKNIRMKDTTFVPMLKQDLIKISARMPCKIQTAPPKPKRKPKQQQKLQPTTSISKEQQQQQQQNVAATTKQRWMPDILQIQSQKPSQLTKLKSEYNYVPIQRDQQGNIGYYDTSKKRWVKISDKESLNVSQQQYNKLPKFSKAPQSSQTDPFGQWA